MVLHESVLYGIKKKFSSLPTAAKVAGGALLGVAALYGLRKLHDHHDEHKPPVKQPEEHKKPPVKSKSTGLSIGKGHEIDTFKYF
jgi:zinc transporter ZupT